MKTKLMSVLVLAVMGLLSAQACAMNKFIIRIQK